MCRESGCLGLVADLLLRAAEVRDLSALQRAFLWPAVAAACACVARAAQDCEENQQRLVSGHEDLAPALFRLLAADGTRRGVRVQEVMRQAKRRQRMTVAHLSSSFSAPTTRGLVSYAVVSM